MNLNTSLEFIYYHPFLTLIIGGLGAIVIDIFYTIVKVLFRIKK